MTDMTKIHKAILKLIINSEEQETDGLTESVCDAYYLHEVIRHLPKEIKEEIQ